MKTGRQFMAGLLFAIFFVSFSGCNGGGRRAAKKSQLLPATQDERCIDARRGDFLAGLAIGVTFALEEQDISTIQQTLDEAAKSPEIVFLLVANPNGMVIARAVKRLSSFPDKVSLATKGKAISGPYQIARQTVHRYARPLTLPAGAKVGEIWAAYDSSH